MRLTLQRPLLTPPLQPRFGAGPAREDGEAPAPGEPVEQAVVLPAGGKDVAVGAGDHRASLQSRNHAACAKNDVVAGIALHRMVYGRSVLAIGQNSALSGRQPHANSTALAA